jgi:hypothetical protein
VAHARTRKCIPLITTACDSTIRVGSSDTALKLPISHQQAGTALLGLQGYILELVPHVQPSQTVKP